jgi:hemerythrin superfamily protein
MAQTQNQDAVRFLQDQHDTIRELFSSVASTAGDERREVFEPLVRLLAVHETAEEMVVYPTIRSTPEGEAIAKARMEEEDEAKKQLADLEKLDPASAEFTQLFTTIRAAVESHAEAEEREVFPLLERITDDEQLQRLGGALRAAEGIAPTHPHKTAPESAIGNMVVGPFVAMIDRARDVIRDAMK